MNARRARARVASRCFAVSISLAALDAVGCSRESAAPPPAPVREGGLPVGANPTAMEPAARGRGYERGTEPKVRVVPAGLRVLAMRGAGGGGGDGSAPDSSALPAAFVTASVPNEAPARKPLAVGDRFGVGEKLELPSGLTIAARSALEGLEVEMVGPALVAILVDETLLLFEGELKVVGATRAPAMIATPDGFVLAPSGTSVRARPRNGTTVSLSGAGSGTGSGAAVATSGEAWESQRVSATLVMPAASARDGDPAGLARCRRMAERARSTWNLASLPAPQADARPLLDASADEARRDAWARQTEARSAARSACAVARLLVERRSAGLWLDAGGLDGGAANAELAASEALWRELPSASP